jgi:hypothetical protein
MNSLRLVLNIVLAIMLLAGGAYLLAQESFFLSDRWNPEFGTLFRGTTLYFLAWGLALLGILAGVVAYGWASGKLPMPDPSTIRPHPAFKGTMIVRFWYLVVPALLLVLLAFLLADKVPNPSLQPTSQSTAAGYR